ncbi:MAG: hypothetical protein HFJ37_01245 [Clostridia bacterium]|nr:hypothetical protein [Clostridia bacterium]
MKNFSTWMLVMFMIMFWIFRIVVAVAGELKWEIGGFAPLNQQMEIILLFVALICIILVIKRKIVGGLLYLLAYGMYFGVDLLNNIQALLGVVESNLGINAYMNLFMSFIGMIIPVAILLDLFMDKGRKNHPKDKKTDWFYDNEQFDRKLDERADKNNYKLG